MLQQYFSMKEENPGCILFFRCGDFFETYGEDAETAARELDIVLTSKDAGEGQKVAMAGVPHFTVDTYVYNLVEKGYKVALADQMEDPKAAKGLVKREVVRILTAGTITEPKVLDSGKNNYLGVVCRHGDVYSAAFCDILTGEFSVVETGADGLEDETEKWSPSEMLLDPDLRDDPGFIKYLEASEIQHSFLEGTPDPEECESTITGYYGAGSISEMEIAGREACLKSCAVMLKYLLETQKGTVATLKRPSLGSGGEFASIDSVTKRNLELLETMAGRERRGTLLWVMDGACTPMGKRLVRNWIVRPLTKRSAIEDRLDAVGELIGSYALRERLAEILKRIQDMERLVSKAVMGSATPRDILALGNSLAAAPELSEALKGAKSGLLARSADFSDLSPLGKRIVSSIIENPPLSTREGEIFRDGVSAELDEIRGIRRKGKGVILSIEERERERTGIKTLKIKYNQIFGYFIEVSKSLSKSVPGDYVRKQTLVNCERYINQELKEYESKVLGAEERIKSLEYELFSSLRGEVAEKAAEIQAMASKIAVLDALRGFAELSSERGYSRPEITNSQTLDIRNGRHPVVELIASGFVSNDLFLDSRKRLSIITGPNMSGKSTYLRQAALIAIMAQTGCYVPADKAVVGIADKFFTRVGATDDLHLGQSTFMVEMLETANILKNATSKSIVILDEIGRGTSTYDGMSIAYAVCEKLYSSIRARTLFATHFHELTSLADAFPGIVNRRVAVKEINGEVIFLHRILEGASDKSYGIYVASIAGFPEDVLEKARKILAELEKEKDRISGDLSTCVKDGQRRQDKPMKKYQLTFFDDSSDRIREEIRAINLGELAPIEALNKIYKWQSELKGK